MTDLATLQTRLSEAEDALHQLHMGRRVVQVQMQNGSTVEYARSRDQIVRLEQYVASLKNQIARAKGKGGRAPLQIWPS